jgi:hypothetical protein
VAQEGHASGAVGAELFDVARVAQIQDAGEQLGLGAEVVQHAGLGDAGPVGDLLQRGVVVAPRGEGVHGDPQDLLPSLLGLEALSCAGLPLPFGVLSLIVRVYGPVDQWSPPDQT